MTWGGFSYLLTIVWFEWTYQSWSWGHDWTYGLTWALGLDGTVQWWISITWWIGFRAWVVDLINWGSWSGCQWVGNGRFSY